MTIKQQGGIFGRNPSYATLDVSGDTTVGNTLNVGKDIIHSGDADTYLRFTDDNQTATIGGTLTYTLTSSGHIYSGLNQTDANTVNSNVSGHRLFNDGSVHHSREGTIMSMNQRYTSGAADYIRFFYNGNNEIGSIGRNSSGDLVLSVSDGGGIDFSATSGTGTSELFDDYEEGTWTPTYTTDGTDFDSVTYDSRTHGRYVKIGSLVYISATLQTDGITVGSASGDVLIGGLPYTSSNDPSNAATYAGAVISSAFAGDMPSEASVDRNATTIRLNYRATSNGASVNLQVADMATSANDNYVQLSFAYRV